MRSGAVLSLAAVSPLAAVAETIIYSPLGAIGVGPSGPASAAIAVGPYCCPATAIVVRAADIVEDNDFQDVLRGLDVPATGEIRRVTSATPSTGDPGNDLHQPDAAQRDPAAEHGDRPPRRSDRPHRPRAGLLQRRDRSFRRAAP